MNQEQWTAVDGYINELFAPHDEALSAALKASDDAGLPSINVTANQGKLLMMLAMMQRATKILEIGTLGGYSTIWLARGLTKGGKLISLEYEPKHATVARGNVARAGLADAVEIITGAALETLPKLEAQKRGPLDLIFIDADKAGYPDYLNWSIKLSRPGTVIVADNVVRDGKIIDAASSDRSVQAVRKFNEMLAKDKRLTATEFQTVGAKGYDGLAIAIVLEPAK